MLSDNKNWYWNTQIHIKVAADDIELDLLLDFNILLSRLLHA